MVCAIEIDNIETLEAAIDFMKKQELLREMELHKAKALSASGFLGKDDIVWTIGSGPLGAETRAYGEYARMSIGIDPRFPNPVMSGNCLYLDKTIEEVLMYDTVPKPTFVISNRYSGINSVLGDILNLETAPICIINPCDCKKCVELYYANSKPKSVFFQEGFPDKSYAEILGNNPAHVDVIDMAMTAKGAGYHSHIASIPLKDDSRAYLLFLSKTRDIIDFFKNHVRGV